MAKFLIAYYNLGEVKKVAVSIQNLLLEKKQNLEVVELELNTNLDLKNQFKKEKDLSLKNKIEVDKFDYIILGSPVSSFTSVPAVNIFIRQLENIESKKFILFATGIGLSGNAIKKMSSLLSMKKGKVIQSKVFSSIFEFDEKKLKEVEKFIENILETEKIN